MSWRYLRTSDHLTNISKLVLSSQQQQQQAFSVAATSSSNSKYSTEIMKLLKPNSLTNITIFFAASLVAGWSMPLLVDGNQEFGDKDAASAVEQDPTAARATGTATESQNGKTSAANTVKATSDKTKSQSYQQKNKKCPSYGCPLLPRDIYFDKEAQAALQTIRNLQKVTTTSTNAAAAATSTDTKASAPDESNNNNGNQNLISLFYNEAYINTDRSEDQATLTLIGYKGGAIHEQINQDRAFVISPFYISNKDTDTEKYDEDENDTFRLLGVFDGHARLGEQVSEYSVRQLPQTLSSKLEPILSSSTSSSLPQQQQQIQEAINDTFIEIDKTAPAHESGGCTASIVLQIHNQVYVANAGDSRSFIATYNKRTRKTSIAYITREDKPDIPEERQRVESAGGVVYVPPPDRMLAGASSRVVYVDKITGSRNGLAMSRSIGDWAAGDHGVIPNPTVDVLDINELIQNAAISGENGSQECIANYNEEKKDDNGCRSNDPVEVFAVSATDGLLDFVDVDNIASTIATSLYETDSPHPLSACESLITAAATSWWQAKNGRYRDDIAIAVSKLSLS